MIKQNYQMFVKNSSNQLIRYKDQHQTILYHDQIYNNRILMSQSLLKRKVAIIGCGPVGMLGSLLFQHLGVQYVAFQKFGSPRSHPSAHWLSANSKSIMSQIPNLVEDINSNQQPWENFRYYRYVQSMFGHQLGITDHFKPSIQQKIQKSVELFGESPNHIPQSLLLQLMFEKVKIKQNLVFDKNIKFIESVPNQQVNKPQYILYDQNNDPVVQVENIVLCSGVNTHLRNNLPSPLSQFHMQGKDNLMNIINIHFSSKKLAQKLKQENNLAMLHFIYGSKIVGILVNHSIQKTGTFVLQIPNYEPFVDLLHLYSARDLLAMIFQKQDQSVINDLNVIHVGKWKLQGILADTMYKDGIFLAGDAAHAYPPAGGFGMNSGFQDINQLAHSIHLSLKNPQSNSQKLFLNYSQNRKRVNQLYLKKALENYEITKNISISLGYSPNILDYFNKSSLLGTILSWLPQNKTATLEQIRLKAMKYMYKRQQLNSPSLDLFFDDFDYSIQKISKIRKQIMKDVKQNGSQSFNLYARKGQIELPQIQSIFGKIDPRNVKFYQKQHPAYKNGQRLINSDGNIIIQ